MSDPHGSGPPPWLFVVVTPYHLLLSLLVSSSAPPGVRCDIVAPTTFAGIGPYCAAVEGRRRRTGAWSHVRIEALPCPPTHRRMQLAAARLVTRRFRAEGYGRVFVCNEARPESLALARLARRRGVPVSTIEDGLRAYGWSNPPIGRTFRASVALTGAWLDRSFVRGERAQWFGRCYTGTYCIAPDLLPAEFGPAWPVPLEARPLAAAADVLIGPEQLDLLPPDAAPGVVVAPLSENPLAPRCAALIRRLERERAGWNGTIAVKHHPRDPVADPFEVAGRPGFVLLDPSVPLEAYLLRRRTAFVAGPPSTALLFARRVFPDLPVSALEMSSEVGQVLRRAGVDPVPPSGPTGLIPA